MSQVLMKDGGLGGQGDEQRVAVEDEHEVNQEQQPDEGVGTRETDLNKVPQRQRGEGVEDGGGSVKCARPAFESSQIALVKASAITGAEAVYACASLRFEPCKTSRVTVVIQRSSQAKVTPNYKAIRSSEESRRQWEAVKITNEKDYQAPVAETIRSESPAL